jgi:hypothetical protein
MKPVVTAASVLFEANFRRIMAVVLFIFLLSCSTKQNKLDGNTQTIQFHYISWACECANWATLQDINKYQDTGKLPEHCVFTEPDTRALALPDTLGYSGDIVEFTGQYYTEKGFPAGYIQTEEPVEKAKVFRYTAYKIIRSNRTGYIEK